MRYTGPVIRGSGSRIRGAGSEIRRNPPPPNLTPECKLDDDYYIPAGVELTCSSCGGVAASDEGPR